MIACAYAPPVSTLVHWMKFDASLAAARTLGVLLAEAVGGYDAFKRRADVEIVVETDGDELVQRLIREETPPRGLRCLPQFPGRE